MTYFIGLISGTSADAIDAALVRFADDAGNTPDVLATRADPLSADLRQSILSLYQPSDNEIDRLGDLDVAIGHAFAKTTQRLLAQAGINAKQITAIGSHGQTLRHRPRPPAGHPFTLQIGDPNVIAQQTGIATIADFRRRDMAAGGQGAPLAPAFHQAVFADPQQDRLILNIGGIANLTLLLNGRPVIGFDTGPGNGLMDAWCAIHLQQPFDESGQWAAQGKIAEPLLNALLEHDYWNLPAPKSTGREEFGLPWLQQHLARCPDLSPVDVQATLLELSARTIANAVLQQTRSAQICVCGGGAHNSVLLKRLAQLLPNHTIADTGALGVPGDYVEAVTFAWLAMRTWHHLTGNLPSVTGAREAVILGGVYPAA